MGRAETLKRRATTGAKRRRAILQARARAAEAAGHSSAGQSRGEVERAAKRRVDGRGDGQWPCLRLAWSRGRATVARVRLGERDFVRYAVGVRAGRRARRCWSAMWGAGAGAGPGLVE